MTANEKKAWELYPSKTKIGQAQRDAYLLGLGETSEKPKHGDVEYDTLTEEEFRGLFELNDGCVIPTKTLEDFSSLIIGAYLIREAFLTDRTVPSSVEYGNSKDIHFTTRIEGRRKDWRDMTTGYGDMPRIEVAFKFSKDSSPIHFWSCETWKNPELKALMGVAYSTMKNSLDLTNIHFMNKFGVSYSLRLHKYKENYWFFDILQLELHKSFCFIDEKGIAKTPSEYQIKEVMAQRGRTPEPYERIIKSIKTEENG